MSVTFAQYCSDHFLTTYIIDDEKNKYFVFEHNQNDGNAYVIDDYDIDPRIEFSSDDENCDEGDRESFELVDNFNMLSGDEEELEAISKFIESGFVVGEYQIEENPQPQRKVDPEILKFWNHYIELNGKLIETFDDYLYYYELFYMLTQNRVGGCCPIPSTIGFELFDKIIRVMCKESGKRTNMKREYSIFFRSIDEVHAYT